MRRIPLAPLDGKLKQMARPVDVGRVRYLRSALRLRS